MNKNATAVRDSFADKSVRFAPADEEKIWRAGEYARLSREDGDKEESDSIGNQKELIRSFAAEKPDITIAASYEDDGYTGVNFDRPGFAKLTEDIKSGKINCVIVKDLSRLGRNYIETGKLLERFFPFMGVRFISVCDAYDSLHHDAQTDNLIIPFKNLINDAYCADISKKIRAGFAARRRKGDFLGSFAAYGYRKDPERKNRLVPDEDAAEVVRDIFDMKIAGMSGQGIADRLNALGVPSPFEYKKAKGFKYATGFVTGVRAEWTAVSVIRILKNELYTGVLTQGVSETPNYKTKQRVQKPESEWARVEGTHEPIVSAEDFALVVRLLNKDTRVAPGTDKVHLFSGLVYCGDCGRALVRKPSKTGDYTYLVCSSYKRGSGCTSHNISEKLIYAAVIECLSLHIRECEDFRNVSELPGDAKPCRPAAARLQKRLDENDAEAKKLNGRGVKLYEDLSDGVLSRDEYLRFKAVFDARAKELKEQKDVIEKELAAVLAAPEDLWAEHFKKYRGIKELTRAVVAETTERIDVYEGKRINISLRYAAAFEDARAFDFAEHGKAAV